MKPYDVVALGEVLIDFTPAGKSENGNPIFERNPGGAPANVLAALSNFGKKTGFLGKVGTDMFGDYLKGVLQDHGIDTAGLLQTSKYNTTLAFVQLDEKGDRTFSFYRNPGADLMLYPYEVNKEMISNCKVFHFGSVSMTGNPAREATLSAAAYAKSLGKIVSYDPNLRELLWENEVEARKYMLEGMPFADILKISEEELYFLIGETSLESGAKLLQEQFDIAFVVVTRGALGCYYRMGDVDGYAKAYAVQTVDTTGAGDAFTAGLLNQLIDKGLNLTGLSKADLEECIVFATVVGSLATTKKGAIPAMPIMEAVLEGVTSYGKDCVDC